MDNKKYIDKVIGSLVRSTKIDYEKEIVSTPLSEFPYPLVFFFYPLTTTSSLYIFLSTYCRYQFGLTEEEIDYVWKEYKDIIKDKISKREP